MWWKKQIRHLLLVVTMVFCVSCSGGADTVLDWKGVDRLSRPESVIGIYDPVVSPDGLQVAFFGTENRTGTGSLYVVDFNGGTVVRFSTQTTGDYVVAPGWNQDGSKLLYSLSGHISILDVATLNLVSTGIEALSAAWSPDSRTIAIQQMQRLQDRLHSAIVLIDAQTLLPEKTLLDREVARDTSSALRWSPVGQSLLAEVPAPVITPTVEINRDLVLYTLGEPLVSSTMVADTQGDEFSPSWSPDGQWVVYLLRQPGTSIVQVVVYSVTGRCRIAGPRSKDLTAVEWTHDPDTILVVYQQYFYKVNLRNAIGLIEPGTSSCR